jgi:hypothetical protein
MAGRPEYAHDLRALGQALEILQIERFEIEPDGDSYLVQILAKRPGRRSDRGPTGESTVRHIWASAPRETGGEQVDTNLLYAMAKTLDLHYTPEDVVRLEKEWRARRNQADRIADPSTLSELLRAAGAYVSEQGGALLKIRRQEGSLVLHYETKSGQKREETLSDSDLWDSTMRMLAKRGIYPRLH